MALDLATVGARFKVVARLCLLINFLLYLFHSELIHCRGDG